MGFQLNSQNLKNISEKYIGNGIKIFGDGHTGRLELEEITKFKISKDVLEITENINN